MVSLLTHQPSSLSQASQPVLSSTFSTLPYSSHSAWNCVFCLFLSPLLQSLDMELCLLSFPLSLTPVTRHGTVSSVFSSLPYSSHSTWNCVFCLFLSPLFQSLDMELCLLSFPLSLIPVTRYGTVSSVFSSLPYSSHLIWNCVFSLFLSPLLQSLNMELCLQSFPLSLTPVTRHGTVSSVFSSLPYSSHSTWNCVFSLFLSPLLQSLDMELCLLSFPLSLTPVTQHGTVSSVFSSLPYSSHSTRNCCLQLENDDSRK